MWIATGYGVEGVLPDGKVGEIRDRILRPLFRQGRYGEGIYLGVKAVGSVLTGGKMETPKGVARKNSGIPLPILLSSCLWRFRFSSSARSWRARSGPTAGAGEGDGTSEAEDSGAADSEGVDSADSAEASRAGVAPAGAGRLRKITRRGTNTNGGKQ